MSEARLSILIGVNGQEAAAAGLKQFGQELGNLGRIAAGFTLGSLGASLGRDLSEQFREVLTETQRFGGEIYKLQGLIGGTAEQASVFLGALEKLGGLESGIASGALTRFSRVLRGQADESDASAQSVNVFNGVLAALGVRATGLEGNMRPLHDVFLDVLDAEKRLGNEGRAGADAMALFGRGAGLQMAPLLRLGAEAFKEAEATAKTLGLQLTGDNVQAVRSFTLAQREAQESLAGLRLQLGLALLGPLGEAAKGVTQLAVAFNQQLVPGIQGAEHEIRILQQLAANKILGDFNLGDAAKLPLAVAAPPLAPLLYGDKIIAQAKEHGAQALELAGQAKEAVGGIFGAAGAGIDSLGSQGAGGALPPGGAIAQMIKAAAAGITHASGEGAAAIGQAHAEAARALAGPPMHDTWAVEASQAKAAAADSFSKKMADLNMQEARRQARHRDHQSRHGRQSAPEPGPGHTASCSRARADPVEATAGADRRRHHGHRTAARGDRASNSGRPG